MKDFDFMVHSVWPEVAELVMTKLQFVFACGIADDFFHVSLYTRREEKVARKGQKSIKPPSAPFFSLLLLYLQKTTHRKSQL